MSRRIRVLIVDDSVVMRRILCAAIASDPQLEVAGHAANGQIALSMLEQVSPDAITLDVEMPVMDGLRTLKALRAVRADVPVIMFSSLTERGAAATIDSLALGASDYVTKSPVADKGETVSHHIRNTLLPKIKLLCAAAARRKGAAPVTCPSPSTRTSRLQRVDVLAIGCSTGGPKALAELLPVIPPDFPVPILIVQHMPPSFTRFLAQRLSTQARVAVEEACEGDELRAGKAWIAPGDYHMVVSRDGNGAHIGINREPPENSCRPSVDVLFRSLADHYPGRVLAVVLTGMGQDGLRGCESLAAAQAQIVVQDEVTSVVWGMPGFVARAGLANAVLPLKDIGGYILERVLVSGIVNPAAGMTQRVLP